MPDEETETQAEPTEGEAEPESTHGDETQAEPTEGEAEPESTNGDESEDGWEPTDEQLQRLAAGLANLDDASLKRGLTTMREQSRLEFAQQLNLSKATMHLGDALVPLARRKILTANSARQMAVAFALAEQTNEETIAALGDRSEDPTREDMLEILPGVIERQGLPLVTLMLASYAASDAKCQSVCSGLLDDDERFALPDPPEVDADTDAEYERTGIVTFTRDTDDPAQAEKRAARKEAKAAKRAAEAARRDANEHAQAARKSAQHRAKQGRPRSS